MPDDDDTAASARPAAAHHVAATAPRRDRVDGQVAAENERWVHGLTAQGREHEETVDSLYRILLRMALTEVRRRGAGLSLSGPELDDIAHQAAADATLIIRRKARTFRGDCRFTTWAYRFVAYDVASKMNRHFWRRATVPIDDFDRSLDSSDASYSPEVQAESRDLVLAVQRILREQLTERQLRTFVAIAIKGLPVHEVARDLGSNPNAVYKMMFDARRKLRLGLEASGYAVPARSTSAVPQVLASPR